MNRPDILFVINTLEEAEAEMEELYRQKEWFVSDLTDMIPSALQIMKSELAKYSEKDHA